MGFMAGCPQIVPLQRVYYFELKTIKAYHIQEELSTSLKLPKRI